MFQYKRNIKLSNNNIDYKSCTTLGISKMNDIACASIDSKYKQLIIEECCDVTIRNCPNLKLIDARCNKINIINCPNITHLELHKCVAFVKKSQVAHAELYHKSILTAESSQIHVTCDLL